jgi:membrane-associated phospholipid phosphatase
MIETIVVLIGLIPGYTQGMTYWHHFDDIITGYSVGAITAFLVAKYVAKF